MKSYIFTRISSINDGFILSKTLLLCTQPCPWKTLFYLLLIRQYTHTRTHSLFPLTLFSFPHTHTHTNMHARTHIHIHTHAYLFNVLTHYHPFHSGIINFNLIGSDLDIDGFFRSFLLWDHRQEEFHLKSRYFMSIFFLFINCFFVEKQFN